MCFPRPRQRSIGALLQQHNNDDINNSEYNRSYNIIIIIICTDRALNEGPSKDGMKKRNTFLSASRQIFIIIVYLLTVYSYIPLYVFVI